MEGDPLELVDGHIHQAWDRAFTSICEVWPTPRAGYWHVWLRGPQSQATKEALASDLVPALLEEWDFWLRSGGTGGPNHSRRTRASAISL